jgi:ABC-type branched-subunit amino acid transport system ATPase component/branched-subunit amino acid ABC-type transport system permease component
MSELIVFVVAGLVAGSVYSLAGVGLVLTYRTSGLLNFAHGAIATISAYAFYSLYVKHGVSWPLAALVSVVGVGVVVGLVLELLARRLQGAPLAISVAATVGLLLVIEAAVDLLYKTEVTRTVPVFLPSGSFTLSGAPVQWSDITTMIIALVLTVALSLLLKFTRLGMATRAVVDDPDLLDSSGLSPVRVRRVSWIAGTMLAAVCGVLFAPLLPLSSVQLTLLVVSAFGAAAIGGFRSLPLTFAGGLTIGVLASLATKYFTTGLLAGVPPSMPFLVLFLVLLVAPKRYLATAAPPLARKSAWVAPLRLQLPLLAVVVVVLGLVPSFAGIHLTAWTVALGTMIIFLSLGLLVRTSGQVSLCQVSFAAIGAAGMSHLAVDHHWPWLLALLVAGLVAVPVGALLAIPAIRLSGLYLALATFGFGILLQYMFYTQDYMFGATGAGLLEPRPHLAGLNSDKGFYFLVLALVVATALLIMAIERARLGRLLRAMADSTTTLETTGTAVNVTRVIVFCIASFLAAIGGALTAVAQSTVSADAFQPLSSLTYLTVAVIILLGAPWNAMVAGLALIIIPSYITGATVSTYLQLIFGASAIAIAVLPRSSGAGDRLRAIVDARLSRRTGQRAAAAPAPQLQLVPPRTQGGLQVSDLQVRFGGNIAVDGISLHAAPGRVTGLIGPNGAGKTTTFNACSGLIRPHNGTVLLDGQNVSRVGPAGRARRGLGRTFQRMQLFDSLTVRENVELGHEGGFAGWNPLRHLASSRSSRRAVAEATQQAIELCDIADLADTQVANLSTGQRRLVDLARCLAGSASVLLLDEPSSGLDHAESERLGRVLQRTVEQRGIAILLVEHDLSLVLNLCAHIYVLDFGHMIFAGTPAEVSASTLVHAAYLGDPAVEDAIEHIPAGDLVGDGMTNEVVA